MTTTGYTNHGCSFRLRVDLDREEKARKTLSAQAAKSKGEIDKVQEQLAPIFMVGFEKRGWDVWAETHDWVQISETRGLAKLVNFLDGFFADYETTEPTLSRVLNLLTWRTVCTDNVHSNPGISPHNCPGTAHRAPSFTEQTMR